MEISTAKALNASSSIGISNPDCSQEGLEFSAGSSRVAAGDKVGSSSLTSMDRSLSGALPREEGAEGETKIVASVETDGLQGEVLLLW